MRARLALLIAALSLPLVASVANAEPDGPPAAQKKKKKAAKTYRAEVMVLHATNTNTGIDRRIGKMPELEHPPFSSYDSYKLLTRRNLPLHKGKARSIRLPNGRILQAELLKVLPNDYVRLAARINQPGGKKTFLPLLEVKAKLEQTFIVAGQSYKNGILVLVIRATERPPRRR